jgi:hypothetical protein
MTIQIKLGCVEEFVFLDRNLFRISAGLDADDIAGLAASTGVLNRGVTRSLPAAGRIRAMDEMMLCCCDTTGRGQNNSKKVTSPEVSHRCLMSTPRSQSNRLETPKWRPNILMSTYAVNMGWKISCENRRADSQLIAEQVG